MKKEYKCPKIKSLKASCNRLMSGSPWLVDDEVVDEQGVKGSYKNGFEDNEDNYPNKVNVWK